jgi:hypothetical protein
MKAGRRLKIILRGRLGERKPCIEISGDLSWLAAGAENRTLAGCFVVEHSAPLISALTLSGSVLENGLV